MPFNVPPSIQASVPAMGELLLTVYPARLSALERLLQLAGATTVVTSAVLLALLYALWDYGDHGNLGRSLATLFALLVGGGSGAALAWGIWATLLERVFVLIGVRARPWTLHLRPTGLRLRDGRALHYAEIAIVSSEADLLLVSGEEVVLAPGEPPDVQAWLAAQLRSAHRQAARGSAADVPATLLAAREGAKIG